jgi:hypothetical protein
MKVKTAYEKARFLWDLGLRSYHAGVVYALEDWESSETESDEVISFLESFEQATESWYDHNDERQ